MPVLPPYARPAQIDRNLIKESFATYKVVCQCGEIRHFYRKDIGQVAAEIEAWHPKHQKVIYYREGGQCDYRGRIAAGTTGGK